MFLPLGQPLVASPGRRAQRGRGCEARRPGPAHCGGGVAGRTCCGCSRPSPPARPSPGTRRPPRGHRGAGASAVGGFRVVPAACLGPGNRRAWPGPWQPSKQQGFLLELVPLPEGQAVELLYAHPEHLLELLRRQVPLQTKRRNPEGAVSSFAAHAREAGPAPHGAAALGTPGPPVPAFPLCPRPSRDAADRTEPGGKGPSATPTHASRTADGGPEHTPRTRTPPAPGHLSPRSVCDVLTRFHGMFMAPPASRRRMAGCAPASWRGETEVRRESREAGPGGPSPTPRPAPPAATVRSAASALPGPRSPSPGTRSGCTAWGQGHRQQSLWDAG